MGCFVVVAADCIDGSLRCRQLSLREWDIPFEEVRLGEVIGRGRFGEVKKGHWHGEVAVKLLNMDDDQALEQFKRDVSAEDAGAGAGSVPAASCWSHGRVVWCDSCAANVPKLVLR